MRCPYCQAEQPAGGQRCADCLLRYELRGKDLAPVLPPIRPGARISLVDLAREPPPGLPGRNYRWPEGSTMTEAPGGVVLSVAPGKSATLSHGYVRVRDAVLVTRATALDGGLVLRAILRRESIGDATMQYSLDVSPTHRRARLARLLGSPGYAVVTSLSPWVESPAIAPVGGANVIEFRAMGSTLEGWVNGACLVARHDPVLGVGFGGVRIDPEEDAPPAARRALLEWFELREVSP